MGVAGKSNICFEKSRELVLCEKPFLISKFGDNIPQFYHSEESRVMGRSRGGISPISRLHKYLRRSTQSLLAVLLRPRRLLE